MVIACRFRNLQLRSSEGSRQLVSRRRVRKRTLVFFLRSDFHYLSSHQRALREPDNSNRGLFGANKQVSFRRKTLAFGILPRPRRGNESSFPWTSWKATQSTLSSVPTKIRGHWKKKLTPTRVSEEMQTHVACLSFLTEFVGLIENGDSSPLRD